MLLESVTFTLAAAASYHSPLQFCSLQSRCCWVLQAFPVWLYPVWAFLLLVGLFLLMVCVLMLLLPPPLPAALGDAWSATAAGAHVT
jgi:hypothetical protein